MINFILFQECQKHAGYLAYWLANTSELVFFLKHDRDLLKISSDIQIHLIKSIQKSYYYLINLFENELDKYLEAFTNSQEDIDLTIHTDLSLSLSDTRWITSEKNPNNYYQLKFDDTLTTLSSIIDLLRKCRVNVTLTIEIFSQIFHYINAWLFNRIVCCPELKLCSYVWGEKFLIRLKSLKTWAHKQGLESSSECHLMKIDQLCLLLKSPKRDLYDVQKLISNNPWQINSLQIKQILTNYIPSRNELPISNNFTQA
jgi:afadin